MWHACGKEEVRIGFRHIKLWRRDNFVNIKIDGRIILKEIDTRNGKRGRGLYCNASGDRRMTSCWESGNEPSFSIE